jgi:hypothetical protein
VLALRYFECFDCSRWEAVGGSFAVAASIFDLTLAGFSMNPMNSIV